MATITSPLAPIITQAQPPAASQINQAQTAQPQTTANTSFGPAVNVNLSAPAEAALNQNTAPPVPQAPAASAPVNTASLIQSADRKVIPLVGISGASEVVDNKGNISKARLAT